MPFLLRSEDVKVIYKSIERIVIAAFTTRNTVPFIGLVVLTIICFRLPPEGLERVATKILDSALYGLLGWVFFLLSLIVGFYLFRWRERIYQSELNRANEVRNKLVEGQLTLKLDEPKK
jgi:hypothetical protein